MVTIFHRKILKDNQHVKTSLYFDYYLKGQKRTKLFTGYTLPIGKKFDKQNVKTLKLLEEKLQAENDKLQLLGNIELAITKPKKHTLIEQLNKHISLQKRNNIYPSLLANVISFISQSEHYSKDIELQAVDYNFISQWQYYMLNTCNLNPNSARAYTVKFSTVFNKAMKQGLINSNPCKRVEVIKKQGIRRDTLTVEELQAISDININPVTFPKGNLYKMAFLFACYTGLRRLSVYNLKWNEIKDNQIQRFDEKTNDFKIINLNPLALELLSMIKVREINGRIFDGMHVENMTPAIQRIVKPLKLNKEISFHTARRSFATLLDMQGIPINDISELLGHKDLSTTKLYVQVSNEKKQSAVNSLPVIRLNKV